MQEKDFQQRSERYREFRGSWAYCNHMNPEIFIDWENLLDRVPTTSENYFPVKFY